MSAKPKTKKVRMTSFMSGNDYAYAPGDIAEFDVAEADRVISVGGGVAHVDDDAGDGEKQPEKTAE